MKQICDLIPPHLISNLAKEHGVEEQSRAFTPASHVLALMFAQVSHALSLNDVCDTLQNHTGALTTMRRAVPPRRNTLSHANRERNPAMAEALFWAVRDSLVVRAPGFGKERRYVAIPRRFRKTIDVIDSTTIQLVANSMDWAKHRRRKAAAKAHVRLNLNTFLPRYAIVEPGKISDPVKARELCAGLRSGEVVLFDKAYNDFDHLHDMTKRGVAWVGRAKDNMAYEIVGERPRSSNPDILLDVEIRLSNQQSRADYPESFRLVRAMVKLEGRKEKVEMEFITNNFEWAATSVCDLYKARWGIETFFKEIKQTLQLSDFLGYNENAVRWQIWTALLAYILLRFIAYAGQWGHGFSRLFTLLRGVLWECLDMFALVRSYGTASAPPRFVARADQAYLPGFGI
jgi:hypothetical protein